MFPFCKQVMLSVPVVTHKSLYRHHRKSANERMKRWVFRRLPQTRTERTVQTWRGLCGDSSQTRAEATAKARSPTVDNHVRRTISDDDDAERRLPAFLCVSVCCGSQFLCEINCMRLIKQQVNNLLLLHTELRRAVRLQKLNPIVWNFSMILPKSGFECMKILNFRNIKFCCSSLYLQCSRSLMTECVKLHLRHL